MRIRGLRDILRDREDYGIVITENGMRRKREREQAQLVREQRAELKRQERERAAGA